MGIIDTILLGAQILGSTASANMPIIQTAFSVAGTIVTPIWACKSTLKAKEILDQKSAERGGAPISKGEAVELCWPYFIGPVALGGLTCLSEIKTTHDLLGQLASTTAVAMTSKKMLEEYRDKNKELNGEGKDRKIKDEIAADRVKEMKEKCNGNAPIIVTDGDILCIDGFSGRMFRSSIEKIRKAVNDVNAELTPGFGKWTDPLRKVYLNDFYSYLDEKSLKPLDIGESALGWTNSHGMEVDFSTQMWNENTPCVVVNYNLVDLMSDQEILSV